MAIDLTIRIFLKGDTEEEFREMLDVFDRNSIEYTVFNMDTIVVDKYDEEEIIEIFRQEILNDL